MNAKDLATQSQLNFLQEMVKHPVRSFDVMATSDKLGIVYQSGRDYVKTLAQKGYLKVTSEGRGRPMRIKLTKKGKEALSCIAP